MMVSTKGRYALRVMADLSNLPPGQYIPLRDIARREEIPRKYLESIMTMLSKAGLVDALQGKGGGYRLNRRAEDYSLGEILRLTEGSLSPVSCAEPKAAACGRAENCRALPIWIELGRIINEYLDKLSLNDLREDENSSSL